MTIGSFMFSSTCSLMRSIEILEGKSKGTTYVQRIITARPKDVMKALVFGGSGEQYTKGCSYYSTQTSLITAGVLLFL